MYTSVLAVALTLGQSPLPQTTLPELPQVTLAPVVIPEKFPKAAAVCVGGSCSPAPTATVAAAPRPAVAAVRQVIRQRPVRLFFHRRGRGCCG